MRPLLAARQAGQMHLVNAVWLMVLQADTGPDACATEW